MSTFSEVRTSKARKFHRCHWCWEPIRKGDTYNHWFWFEEASTTKAHPECLEASQKADLLDECWPPPGTFRRGCHCEEKIEHCTCKESKTCQTTQSES